MATKLTWAATPDEVAFLPRTAVHDMVLTLIDRLDLHDGDPDDETDLIEDDFFDAHPFMGPGCPIADPGGGDVEDQGERAAWVERIDQSRQPGVVDGFRHATSVDEDEEDDDAKEADGDELDGSAAEDEAYLFRPGDTPGADGAGCPISDPIELNGDEGDYGGEVDGV